VGSARATSRRVSIVSPTGDVQLAVSTLLAEEPLAILVKEPGEPPALVTTTLRTPGDDMVLAVGLVVSEGIVAPGAIVGVSLCPQPGPGDVAYRQATVVARGPIRLPTTPSLRTSSCGWCGTEDLADRLAPAPRDGEPEPIELAELYALGAALEAHQAAFRATHASHAALIAQHGEPIAAGEDVGRHNALDKAIGRAVLSERVLTGCTVVLSGRIGIDLLAKAIAIGARAVVAFGAPTERAVRTALAARLVLAGVLRRDEVRLYANDDLVTVEGRPIAGIGPPSPAARRLPPDTRHREAPSPMTSPLRDPH